MTGVGFAQRLPRRAHIVDNLNGRGKYRRRPPGVRSVAGRQGRVLCICFHCRFFRNGKQTSA